MDEPFRLTTDRFTRIIETEIMFNCLNQINILKTSDKRCTPIFNNAVIVCDHSKCGDNVNLNGTYKPAIIDDMIDNRISLEDMIVKIVDGYYCVCVTDDNAESSLIHFNTHLIAAVICMFYHFYDTVDNKIANVFIDTDNQILKLSMSCKEMIDVDVDNSDIVYEDRCWNVYIARITFE